MTMAFAILADDNYASRLRVLHESIRKFHPDAPIMLFTWGQWRWPEDVEVVQLPSFPLEAPKYALVKGWLIDVALAKYERVCHLGSDMELFASMNQAESMLERHDLVLVPHILKALPW